MNEGGQSSTGQLIDFVITTHAAYPELQERAKQEQKNIHQGQPNSCLCNAVGVEIVDVRRLRSSFRSA